MGSLVGIPIQLQLRRVVLTRPIYMPLPKLEVHSDSGFTKIMPVWSPIIPNIMLVLENHLLFLKLC